MKAYIPAARACAVNPRYIIICIYCMQKIIVFFPGDNFGFDAVVHPDGCTISGKGNGQVYLSEVKDFNFPQTFDLTTPLVPSTTNYMYSKVIWKKLNGLLGGDDMLTCRGCHILEVSFMNVVYIL